MVNSILLRPFVLIFGAAQSRDAATPATVQTPLAISFLFKLGPLASSNNSMMTRPSSASSSTRHVSPRKLHQRVGDRCNSPRRQCLHVAVIDEPYLHTFVCRLKHDRAVPLIIKTVLRTDNVSWLSAPVLTCWLDPRELFRQPSEIKYVVILKNLHLHVIGVNSVAHLNANTIALRNLDIV